VRHELDKKAQKRTGTVTSRRRIATRTRTAARLSVPAAIVLALLPFYVRL